MGEMADLMINGDLCGICGVYMEGEGEGFPRYCSGCEEPDSSSMPHYTNATPCKTKAQCPECKKWVKSIGLPQHIKDKH